MTTSQQSLTPKQKQVLAALESGARPSEIATKMNISSSGVYGHIRNIRAAGHSIPGEHAPNGDQPTDEVPLGRQIHREQNQREGETPERYLEQSISALTDEISATEETIAGYHEAIAVATEKAETLNRRLQKLVAALDTLA